MVISFIKTSSVAFRPFLISLSFAVAYVRNGQGGQFQYLGVTCKSITFVTRV